MYKFVRRVLHERKKSVLVIILIFVFIFFGFRGGPDKDLIKTANVEKDTIKSEVFTTGKVESESQSDLHFAVTGKVAWVPVKEGDFIDKGQVVATLDKEKFEIALRQAQQDVVAADAKLEKAYDDLPDNRIESYQDKINRTSAEAVKNQAFDAVKLAERNLKDTVLTSPIGGTVTRMNIKPGEEILVTYVVAQVSDTTNIHFTADIDETDIGSIKPDQSAAIFLDSYPEEEIKSKVEKIGSFGTTSQTESTVFKVDFFLSEDSKFIIGMNGDAQITTAEKQQVLTIPTEALVDENMVYIHRNNAYEKILVEVGMQNDSQVEILSGLSEGDQVVTEGFDEIGKKSLIQKLLLK